MRDSGSELEQAQDSQRQLRWMNSVRVLRLRPGDMLVVTVERVPSEQALANIREALDARFPDNKVLIVTPEVELNVVRTGESA